MCRFPCRRRTCHTYPLKLCPYDGLLFRAWPVKAIIPMKEMVMGSDIVFAESLNFVFAASGSNWFRFSTVK